MGRHKIPHYSSKIGRNTFCPCGSGKKYKHCHANSTTEPVLTPGRLDAQARRLVPARKCLAPASMTASCAGGTINAHTVSRSGSLGAIARKFHVYSYKLSIEGLNKSGGKILPTLVGWREASTFPGFCSTHDKALFAPLEDESFTGSAQQIFLLAYRIVARELYTKLSSSQQSDFRNTLANSNDTLSGFMSDFNLGVALGLRDAERHKDRYDKVLENNDWGSVRAILFQTNAVYPIQCAGGFFPEKDIRGRTIQDFGVGKKAPDVMTLASFVADGRSYISFCWLKDSDASCNAYITALLELPQSELASVLGAILLQVSENCHFSPDWYDNLPVEGKEWVCLQAHAGLPSFNLLPKVSPPVAYKDLPYLSAFLVEAVVRLL